MFIALAFLFSAIAAYCIGFFYFSAKSHHKTLNSFADDTLQLQRNL